MFWQVLNDFVGIYGLFLVPTFWGDSIDYPTYQPGGASIIYF